MSEMSDIVSELRTLHAEILASDEGRECEMMALVRKSADEIERLHQQRDELLALCIEMREWLKPELVEEPHRTFFWKLVRVTDKAEGRSDE